jgi:hypothetical protein
MKLFNSVLVAAALIISFFSCQKELSFENGLTSSAGVLLQDAKGNCLPIKVNGVYKTDTTLNDTNFAEVQISVTAPGSYAIKSDTVNGYSFSGTGTVSAAGVTTVRLLGTGKPIASGANSFTVKYSSSACSFVVNVIPVPTAFTLGGAPGACTPIAVNGVYTAYTALDSTNTAVVQVNVASIGAYKISTDSVNGMVFSASGIFTATGPQHLILQGRGTPATIGSSILTPNVGTSSCTFTITTGAPSDVFKCNINGTPASFIGGAHGFYVQGLSFSIDGGKVNYNFPGELLLAINTTTPEAITAGTYTNNVLDNSTGHYFIFLSEYFDVNAVYWSPKPNYDPFTITITYISATRVVGTFSGTVTKKTYGNETNVLTNGVFNLPVQ